MTDNDKLLFRFVKIKSCILALLTETNRGYWESHDLRDESVHVTCAISEESYAEAGLPRPEQFLLVGSINFQMTYYLGSDIINVAIV